MPHPSPSASGREAAAARSIGVTDTWVLLLVRAW
jgi:hypothetical protein